MEIKTVQPHMRLLFSINKKRERTVSDTEEGQGREGFKYIYVQRVNSIPVLSDNMFPG